MDARNFPFLVPVVETFGATEEGTPFDWLGAEVTLTRRDQGE